MEWKIDNSLPVYVQIKAHIRDAVLTNEFPPGSRIPSVRDLAAQANVNPNTMQRALTELEHEGLLISNGTLGRFVTDDSRIIDAMHQEAIAQAVRISAEHFKALGLSMEEAGRLISCYKEEN